MTILEGMKELKLIEKKIVDATTNIQKASSDASNIKPMWGTPENQKKKIAEFAQSAEDLAARYAEINAQINYTNLMIVVDYQGKRYSLNDLLQYRRKIAPSMKKVYEAMNDLNFNSNSRREAGVVLERYYDPEFKEKKRAQWQDFYEGISARLEVVNATTQLLDMPTV